jgi:hypothetical protein
MVPPVARKRAASFLRNFDFAAECKLIVYLGEALAWTAYRYLSVTAPSEAVLTSLAYFARTPRVSFGGSGL